MAEYIEREAVYNTLKAMYCDECTDEKCQMCEYAQIMFVLDNLPTADVQPVKHGRWIPQGDDMWLCSNCKENIIFSMHESDRTKKQRYCCKCGARMDGGIDG